MYPWGMHTEPPRPGPWKAGWRHAPPRPDDYLKIFPERLEAWLWLRTELNWMVDDHYTEERFAAAHKCANIGTEYYGKAFYIIEGATYFLEPYDGEI